MAGASVIRGVVGETIAADSTGGLFEEVRVFRREEVGCVGTKGGLGLGDIESGAVEDVKSLFDLVTFGGFEARAPQADEVESIYSAGFQGGGDTERGDVLDDGPHGTNHGETANIAELMDRGASAHEHPVANGDVSGQKDAIGHDDVVAHGAIVGDMGIGHHEDVAAQLGGAAGFGSAMDGDAFTEGAVVAGDHIGWFAAKGQVLGQVANDGAGMQLAVVAESDMVQHNGMGTKDAAFANHRGGRDVGPGTDLHIRAQPGARLDNGRWMDHKKLL